MLHEVFPDVNVGPGRKGKKHASSKLNPFITQTVFLDFLILYILSKKFPFPEWKLSINIFTEFLTSSGTGLLQINSWQYFPFSWHFHLSGQVRVRSYISVYEIWAMISVGEWWYPSFVTLAEAIEPRDRSMYHIRANVTKHHRTSRY